MPSKNVVKQYIGNGYYHIYNRGVDKRIIFQDSEDYAVFISYLKEYLEPRNEEALRHKLISPLVPVEEKEQIRKLLRLNNLSEEITLLAYCLMPNHFHFLIKQKNSDSMDKFMNSLGTRYTMYFNKKYQRVGRLYQDVYRAVLVTSDQQLLHLSRYIHKQVLSSFHLAGQDWLFSYPEYIGERKTSWVDPTEVLSIFSTSNPNLSYRAFVQSKENITSISKLLLEKE